MKKLVFTILLFLGMGLYVSAQHGTDSVRHIIETIDGNEYNAKILEETEEYLLIETEILGELKIPKQAIKSITKITISELIEGEFWFDNPHATRYFYSPNGYNLKEGEGYFQNAWVFFNQLSYGITDNVSLGGGMMPTFLLGAGMAPVWITPKIGIPVIKDKLNVGLGVLAATIVGESEGGFGIAYGTVSHGSRDKNTTLGVGWTFTSDGFGKYPTLSLSGMTRLSKKGFFITENYLISTKYETIGLIAFGGRSVQKKLAIDYGLIVPVNTGADRLIAIPWLSITIPFGNAIQK